MDEQKIPIDSTDPVEYESFQKKLLCLHLPEIIRNTPAFAEYIPLLDGLGENNVIEKLRQLPIMSKQNILGNPVKYHRTDISEKIYPIRTGGTSGEILEFSRIKSEYMVEKNHIEYCWKNMGIQLGTDKGVVLNARPSKHSTDGLSYVDKNKMMWLACKDQSEKQWEMIYEKIVKYEPKYIRGYGSLVSAFFKQLSKQNRDMPSSIEAVAYSSDPILQSELDFISQNYCENIISLYGQTERVTMGVTCRSGNKFHLLPTYGFTEIIRDDGSVIEKPGEIGEIVATSLYPRYCSFVRYRTGDMGVWSDELCSCGRSTPTIDQLLQRSHEKAINKFGEKISMARRPSFIDMKNELPVGTGIQFLQNQPGHLHVLIQTSEKNEEIFAPALNHLRNEFIVSHEFVNQPILRENGKRTLFIQTERKTTRGDNLHL